MYRSILYITHNRHAYFRLVIRSKYIRIHKQAPVRAPHTGGTKFRRNLMCQSGWETEICSNVTTTCTNSTFWRCVCVCADVCMYAHVRMCACAEEIEFSIVDGDAPTTSTAWIWRLRLFVRSIPSVAHLGVMCVCVCTCMRASVYANVCIHTLCHLHNPCVRKRPSTFVLYALLIQASVYRQLTVMAD